LNITQKEFKQSSKWAENVYNTVVVIDYFVASQPEIEECYNLAPVVKQIKLRLNFVQIPFKRCSKNICVGMILFEVHTVDASSQKSDKLCSFERSII